MSAKNYLTKVAINFRLVPRFLLLVLNFIISLSVAVYLHLSYTIRRKDLFILAKVVSTLLLKTFQTKIFQMYFIFTEKDQLGSRNESYKFFIVIVQASVKFNVLLNEFYQFKILNMNKRPAAVR